jgi:hypothetical protein
MEVTAKVITMTMVKTMMVIKKMTAITMILKTRMVIYRINKDGAERDRDQVTHAYEIIHS